VRRLISLLFALDLLAVFGLVRPLRLASHYPGETLAVFDIIHHTTGATIRFTLLTTAMVAVYLCALRTIDGLEDSQLTVIVFGGAALLALTFLQLYPATSSDLFHYAMEGRILWVYHNNPFTTAPLAFPSDPFFFDRLGYQTVVWADLPSPYGPVWALLTGIPILLGHNDPFWTFISFKLLAFGFYFLAARFIFLTVRQLRPGREWSATLLFTWNPLILLYVGDHGANDVIMMALVLGAVYFGISARWQIVFPLLALATLVKFVSGLLLPIFVVYALVSMPRQRWRAVAEGLGVAAFVTAILYAPFWRGIATFTGLRYQTKQFTDSPPALLHHWLTTVTTAIRAEIITKSVSYVLLAVAYALVVRYVYVRRTKHSPDDLPSALFAVMCSFLVLSMFWFQPWYLIWLISLGALTVGVRRRLTLLFTMTGLLAHTATSIAALKGWYFDVSLLQEATCVVVFVFGLPGLYIAGVLLSHSGLGGFLKRRIQAPRGYAGSASVGSRRHAPTAEV